VGDQTVLDQKRCEGTGEEFRITNAADMSFETY
jgi:hypothetical protein